MSRDFNYDFNETSTLSADTGINDELDMLKNSLGHHDPNISYIPIKKCRHYKNHVFSIGDISNLAEDIVTNGLIHPIVARKIGDDEYEIISGHRRYEASKAAGMTSIEAYIIEVDDTTADLFMVNANLLQRQHFSKVELAKAYRIRLAYERHQGKKDGEQMYIKFGREMGRSESYAKRILYLSKLSDSLLDLIDENLLPATAAERLRTLSTDQMEELARLIRQDKRVLTLSDAITLVKSATEMSIPTIWPSLIDAVPPPMPAKNTITIPIDRSYIPEGVSDEEFRKKILEILEQHFNA